MNQSVAVIGTIFIDCKGFAKQAYHADSRNLGSIQFVHGGVARNVAENLAHLEIPTTFISTIDETGIGNEVISRLTNSGVGINHLARTKNNGMGMWLAILDENGNLAGSISQMPDLDNLGKFISSKGEQIIRQSSHVVLELDLNEEISKSVITLANAHQKPVYGIPGNLDVVLKHPELLQTLECFICNHFEAANLLKTDLSDLRPEAMTDLLKAYVDATGLRSMVITLGEHGAVFYDAKTQQSGHQPVFPIQMVDSSGAGDAFFSGTVMGLVRGVQLQEAVICGTKVAGWTLESAENTCMELKEKTNQDSFFQGLKMESNGI